MDDEKCERKYKTGKIICINYVYVCLDKITVRRENELDRVIDRINTPICVSLFVQ